MASVEGLAEPTPPQVVIFRQRPWIPWWVPVALAMLAALAVAIIALVITRPHKVTTPAVIEPDPRPGTEAPARHRGDGVGERERESVPPTHAPTRHHAEQRFGSPAPLGSPVRKADSHTQ